MKYPDNMSYTPTSAGKGTARRQVSLALRRRDSRSVMTLSPPLDKDLFHIHSNLETMTYQSLAGL